MVITLNNHQEACIRHLHGGNALRMVCQVIQLEISSRLPTLNFPVKAWRSDMRIKVDFNAVRKRRSRTNVL